MPSSSWSQARGGLIVAAWCDLEMNILFSSLDLWKEQTSCFSGIRASATSWGYYCSATKYCHNEGCEDKGLQMLAVAQRFPFTMRHDCGLILAQPLL